MKVFLFIACLLPLFIYGQVTIVSADLNSFYISANNLFNIIVMNNSPEPLLASLKTSLTSTSGEMICSGTTNTFTIKPGLNRLSGSNAGITQFNYGTSSTANLLRTSHVLPNGNYRYCASLTLLNDGEFPVLYCKEVISTTASLLKLITPYNKQEIQTKNPLLVWTHSESFSALANGEYFQMIVSEKKKNQSAQEAIGLNVPLFIRRELSSHQILYPNEAQELISGKNYVWQVQKISGGRIVQKTEAWEFHLAAREDPGSHQYIVLESLNQQGYYEPDHNNIYFSLSENYTTTAPDCAIYNSGRDRIKPSIRRDDRDSFSNASIKKLGDNRFAIDLIPYHLKKGFYDLEVKNIKNEMLKARFLIK